MKRFVPALLLPLVALVVCACAIPLLPAPGASSATLTLSVAGSSSRTVLPTMSWDHLTATLTSASGTTTLDHVGLSTTVPVAPGALTVAIQARSALGQVVGLGAATLTIVAGENAVTVRVLPVPTGSGSFHLDLHYVEKNVGWVTVELIPWANPEATTTTWDELASAATATPLPDTGLATQASYRFDPAQASLVLDAVLPSGLYRLRTQLYGEGPIGGASYGELVQISQGLVSAAVIRNPSHNVLFDAGGGTGKMDPQPIPFGATANLAPNAFSRPGWAFGGWMTPEEDLLADQDPYTMKSTGDVTLVAQWTASVTLHFEANGGTGTVDDIIAPENGTVNLPSTGFTNSTPLYRWSTDPSGKDPAVQYVPGASYVVPPGGATLYAIWAQVRTVSFNGNGADLGNMQPVSIAETQVGALTPNAFSNGSKYFQGWTTHPDGTGELYLDGANYTMGGSNVTLYALWTDYPVLLSNGNFETVDTDPLVPQNWTIDAQGNNQGGPSFRYWGLPAHSGTHQISATFHVSTHSQVVDLVGKGLDPSALQSGGAEFTFSEWVASGSVGGTAWLTIELLDASDNVIAANTMSEVGWSSYSPEYLQAAVTVLTPSTGAPPAKVRVTGSGQSGLSWAGNYGPSFDDAALLVTLPNL